MVINTQGIYVSVIEPGLVKTGLPGTMWSAAERALGTAREDLRGVYEKEFLRVSEDWEKKCPAEGSWFSYR